jgi:hypothetical protein
MAAVLPAAQLPLDATSLEMRAGPGRIGAKPEFDWTQLWRQLHYHHLLVNVSELRKQRAAIAQQRSNAGGHKDFVLWMCLGWIWGIAVVVSVHLLK